MLPCVNRSGRRSRPHDTDLRRTSIRTPTVRQKRCIRAQLSSSSLQKILTEQGMLEIDPLTLGPRNGDDAASPTGQSRNLQPLAEPQDELPRDRRAIVAPVKRMLLGKEPPLRPTDLAFEQLQARATRAIENAAANGTSPEPKGYAPLASASCARL
jgi:hypothetical protein